MNKYIISANQKIGKFYAGDMLPDGAILIGTIKTPKGEGALLQLKSGHHVRFNAGYVTEFIPATKIVKSYVKQNKIQETV